jgi:hypothetical protein
MMTPKLTNNSGLVPTMLFLTVLLLGACSRGEPEAPPPQAPASQTTHDNVIGQPLHQALDQANQVEQMIQDGVDQREQAMKAQGL